MQEVLLHARQCLPAFGTPGCSCPARFQYKHIPCHPPSSSSYDPVSGQSRVEKPLSFTGRVYHCHTVGLGGAGPLWAEGSRKAEVLPFSVYLQREVKMPLGPCPVREWRACAVPEHLLGAKWGSVLGPKPIHWLSGSWKGLSGAVMQDKSVWRRMGCHQPGFLSEYMEQCCAPTPKPVLDMQCRQEISFSGVLRP